NMQQLDLDHYILRDGQPIICSDLNKWQQFIEDSRNVLLVQHQVGQYQIITVFLGFNHGTTNKPQFFQTNFFGGSGSKPRYTASLPQALVMHRAKVACAEGLTRFAAERAAGINRSFKAIDCKVVPGEFQFVLESEMAAILALPENKHRWKRRGNVLVFLWGQCQQHRDEHKPRLDKLR
ncbi:MAG: hypothetical protein AAF329_23370, partial [Cyanobacteria bacterium P01_A01_bin.17]